MMMKVSQKLWNGLRSFGAGVLTLGLTVGVANAADYYVSPGGTGDGSSWDSPFGTVEAGIAAAKAADEASTVWLDSGTHEISQQKQLELDAAITLRGRTGVATDVTLTRPAADKTAKIGYRILKITHKDAVVKDMTVSGGYLVGSTADQCGGNIDMSAGLVENCIIENADCTSDGKNDRGGGINITGGRVTRCIIRKNKIFNYTNYAYGTGVMISGSSSQIDNCLITGNSGYNGALRIQGGTPLVYNCTIVGNTSASSYPGIHFNASAKIYNCIIADNTSTATKDPATLAIGNAAANATYNKCLKGCVGRVKFNADCLTGLLLFHSGTYAPVIGCIGIDNAALQEIGWTTDDKDLAGNARVVNSIADAGCYEWSSATAGEELTVTAAAESGTAPFAASIQANVNGYTGPFTYTWTVDGVAETTTEPTLAKTFSTVGYHTVTLSVADGSGTSHAALNTLTLTVQGASVEVDGTTLTPQTAVDLVADGGEMVLKSSGSPYTFTDTISLTRNITVRGETGKPEDVICTRAANTGSKTPFRMFLINSASAVVRDLTIEKGNISGSAAESYGANILIDTNGGTVSNCIVRGGSTSGSGNHRGGGIAMYAGLVDHCVITNNTAGNSGYNHTPGVYITGGTLVNSLIAKNTGHNGSVYASGSVKIYNCTITGNSSADTAGIHLNNASPRVINTIVAKNTGSTAAGGVYNSEANAKACMTYCLVDSAVADANATNITGSPDFTDAANGDYTTYGTSPNVDAGNNDTTAFGAGDTDLAGNPRIDTKNAKLDIGCYEYTVKQGVVTVGIRATSAAKGNTPFNAAFSASVEGLDGEKTYIWDFGDGTATETTTSDSATHTYETAGVYAATVTVKDANANEYPAAMPVTMTIMTGQVIVDGTTMTLDLAYQIVGDNGEIILKTGTHTLTNEFAVERPVTIRGETGNPADVTVVRDAEAGVFRLFTLNNAAAKLKDLTLKNGCINGKDQYGATVSINANGGTVEHCVVTGGQCTNGAGNNRCAGIFSNSSAGLITRCVITNNTCVYASYTGGVGAYLFAGRIDNTLIAGNSGRMGALYVSGSAKAYNCTIAGNTSSDCAGIYFGSSGPSVVNCIIANNKGNSDTANVYAGAYNVTAAKILPCFNHCVAAIELNDTCIVGTPDFVTAGDYHTTKASCNVGAGDNTKTAYTEGDLDLDGNARLRDDAKLGALDIGCYQWKLVGLEVAYAATYKNGTLPCMVTFTPQVEGASGDYVCWWDFDGDGIYEESSAGETTHTYTEAGTYATSLKVAYGGKEYAASSGKSIHTYPAAFDVSDAAGLLAAVAAGGDGTVITVAEGTYALTETLRVTSGLTLRGATGRSDDVRLRRKDNWGPILFVNHADAFVADVTLEGSIGGCADDNTAATGLRIDANGGTVSNCVVRYCSGVKDQHYNVPVFMKAGLLTHAKIYANTNWAAGCRQYAGGGVNGVYMTGGTLANALIADNRLFGTATPSDENSGFGPLVLGSSSAKVVNCTVAGNEGAKCGGITIMEGSVINTLIAGNRATDEGVAASAHVYRLNASSFDHCLGDTVQINDTCITGDPLYKNAEKGDWRVRPASPAIDAGKGAVSPLPALDLRGKPRVFGKTIDIGCYESQSAGFTVIIR